MRSNIGPKYYQNLPKINLGYSFGSSGICPGITFGSWALLGHGLSFGTHGFSFGPPGSLFEFLGSLLDLLGSLLELLGSLLKLLGSLLELLGSRLEVLGSLFEVLGSFWSFSARFWKPWDGLCTNSPFFKTALKMDPAISLQTSRTHSLWVFKSIMRHQKL